VTHLKEKTVARRPALIVSVALALIVIAYLLWWPSVLQALQGMHGFVNRHSRGLNASTTSQSQLALAQPGTGQPEVLGDVRFPSSCNEEAQTELNRAVALLHSFWRGPALQSFGRVAELDEGCGIAYWGIGMAALINPFDTPLPGAIALGREAVEQGQMVGAPTQRERDYIDAIAAYYAGPDETPLLTRRRAYEQAMEQVYLNYPDDTEAPIFYALALNTARELSDTTYARPLQAAAILEPLYAQYPNHPGIAHYLIHSYDYPSLAAQGLDAARGYARIAPSVPHALHMPSHIFTLLGLWEESIATNLAAMAAAPGEPPHVLDFLAYGYLQLAQDAAANAVLERAAGLSSAARAVLLDLAAIRARYVVEQGQWGEAVTLPMVPRETTVIEAAGATYFARALGAARSGNLSAARENIDLMAALGQGTGPDDAYWAEQVDIWREEAAAWLALAEGKQDEALQLMRSAADRADASHKAGAWSGPILPARELLGELLLEVGSPQAALQEFETSLTHDPNRFRGLAGAGRSAELTGDTGKAVSYYTQLLALAQRAESERPELQQARAFLARRGTGSR
jgi:tetratricopeptide (TPR) repeat protein